MLKSTFPSIAANEALWELKPSRNDGVGGRASKTPPILRAFDGSMAGWLDAPASARRCPEAYALADADFPRAATSSSVSPVAEACGKQEHPPPMTTKASARSSAPAATGGGSGCNSSDRNVNGARQCAAATSTNDTCSSNNTCSSASCVVACSSDDGAGSGDRFSEGQEMFFATASKDISRGEVVAVERPLAAVQTAEALPWVVVCPGCLRHVGGLDLQLAVASGKVARAKAFGPCVVAMAPSPPLATGVGIQLELGEQKDNEEERGEGARLEKSGDCAEGCSGDGGEGGVRCSGRAFDVAREDGGNALEGLPPLRGLSERFADVSDAIFSFLFLRTTCYTTACRSFGSVSLSVPCFFCQFFLLFAFVVPWERAAYGVFHPTGWLYI